MSSVQYPSPQALSNLDRPLSQLLDAGHSHNSIVKHIRQFILDRSKDLPPRQVIINTEYGGFGISSSVQTFLENKLGSDVIGEFGNPHPQFRENPEIVEALKEYGEEVCGRLPFLRDDWRTALKWNLDRLWGSGGKKVGTDIDEEFQLKARAELFKKEWAESLKRVGSFTQTPPFEEFAKAHPDQWMRHFPRHSRAMHGPSLGLAHVLLKEEPQKFRVVSPDPKTDDDIHLLVALACASDGHSFLEVQTVPAVVDYRIEEYDGMERIAY